MPATTWISNALFGAERQRFLPAPGGKLDQRRRCTGGAGLRPSARREGAVHALERPTAERGGAHVARVGLLALDHRLQHAGGDRTPAPDFALPRKRSSRRLSGPRPRYTAPTFLEWASAARPVAPFRTTISVLRESGRLSRPATGIVTSYGVKQASAFDGDPAAVLAQYDPFAA